MSRTARHTPASRSLLLIDSLLGLAAFATAVPTLLALAAAQAWWLELFSHFRLQYLAAQLVLLAALALRRRWRMSLLLIPLAALNASATSAYWPREPNPVSGRPDVRIMTANLYETHPTPPGSSRKRSEKIRTCWRWSSSVMSGKRRYRRLRPSIHTAR
jgi:hypothetical protein